MRATYRVGLAWGGVLLLCALPLVAPAVPTVVEERVPPVRPAAIPGRSAPADDTVPSPVLLPPRSAPLAFDHRAHRETPCARCHPDAAGSRRAADELGPAASVCVTCHEDEPERRLSEARRPRVYLRFDHAAHTRAGLDCAVCHAAIASSRRLAAVRTLPRMGDCLGCHDGRRAADGCGTCHLTDGDGRVRWRLPTGRLVPTGRSFGDRHDESFLRRHRVAAARDRRHCGACHEDAWCQSCHDGAARPAAVHPPGFVALHAVPARKDPRSCAACHTSSADCIACHRRSHVVSEGEQRFPTGDDFHPAGWTVSGSALPGPAHHGREARRNLRACVSCHREQTCLACHRSRSAPTDRPGGSRGVFANPHGRDFGERCGAMRERNEAVCLRCHAPTDAALRRCR